MTTENLARLFEWGDPMKRNSPKHGWENYLQQGFSTADVPGLINLLTDKKLHNGPLESNDIWVPLYAWRILGQLRSADAIEPIISLLDFLNDDDWALTEIPEVMGMIGEPAIMPLCRVLLDQEGQEYSRIMASDCVVEIGKQHPELRDVVITQLREYLLSPDPACLDLNGLLVCGLIDLNAVEVIDEIRALFQQDYVDITISGDLEDVELALGLRVKRETPNPHYGLSGMPDLNSLLDTEDSAYPETPLVKTHVRDAKKKGRNDPCPCGSGKKYKRCCLH